MADYNFDESFETFKNSFRYGSRTDLIFKFLGSLTGAEAAQFFQELLWKLGDSFDDGDFDRITDHVYQWQITGFSSPESVGHLWRYDEGAFAPLSKPLSEARLGLLTASGHFVIGDDPNPFGAQNMSQEEAVRRIREFGKSAPQLSAIPIDTPPEKLRARHPGYDIRGAQADNNVVLPLARLRELEQEGLIGQLAPAAYSFVGICSQLRVLNQTGPQLVELFQGQQIDAALLVPV